MHNKVKAKVCIFVQLAASFFNGISILRQHMALHIHGTLHSKHLDTWGMEQ